jgi:PAS domain S-box-containing protein
MSSDLFARAVEMSLDGIVIGDEKGNVTYVNEAIVKMMEAESKEELVGKHILDFVAPAERQRAIENSQKCETKGAGWKDQFTATTKTGKKIPVELTAAPIKDEKGQIIAFIDIVRTIGDRLETETRLREAHQNLALANEKLLVMGGVVRHDIANKLNVLNMKAYLAKKDGDLEALLKSTQTVCCQIRRVIEFSRDYEMLGKEAMAYINVGIVFDEVTKLFPDAKIEVINECHGLEVLADSLLRELFYNLFENTLKYGQNATKIRLSHTLENEQLKLIYEDNGVGIVSKMKPKLFTKGAGQGSGLGLYLIKKTAEVYGWSVEEIGTEGKNAKFAFTIPQTTCKQ